ncbi:CAP domain-containing protein [Rhizobium sp. PAMB 3182]
MQDEATAIAPTRRMFFAVSAAAAASLLSACTTSNVLNTDDGNSADMTAEALPLVNELRAKSGLPPLAIDRHAQAAALDQARRMARAGEMQHNIGFGADFGKRMKGQDVQLPAAENIASGQRSTEDAVTAWINSPKHLKNMLGSYKGLGVAVARNSASGNRPYWSMVLSG